MNARGAHKRGMQPCGLGVGEGVFVGDAGEESIPEVCRDDGSIKTIPVCFELRPHVFVKGLIHSYDSSEWELATLC
jgi:hypothetical protein